MLSFVRSFSSSSSAVKVAVLGASGGIGQPLSLLLKSDASISKYINHLALYDIVHTPGVAADISHINAVGKVTGHLPENNGLKATLEGAHVVVIPAGIPRKPGMTRDDLFNTNAGIVRDLVKACGQFCPKAHLLIISNPVNSTVPIAAEVLKKAGVFDPKRVFGVTTLDSVRSSRFGHEVRAEWKPSMAIPVIGGHSGPTIVPLTSQVAQPKTPLSKEELDALVHRIQYGGDEVVKAKSGTGSATLSMAFAGARFTRAILDATVGKKKDVIEPTYINLSAHADGQVVKKATDGCDYFATNVLLGENGVEKIHSFGKLSDYETELLKKCVPELKKNIQKGLEFANKA